MRKLWGRLVDKLIWRAERTPYIHLPGYMNRWWLVPYGRGPFGIAVRVHEILRSDDDRALHDHPWSFISIVLRGRYLEVVPCGAHGARCDGCRSAEGADAFFGSAFGRDPCSGEAVIERKAGSIVFRRASDFHRIALPLVPGRIFPVPVWTLFITFRKRQEWGFKVLARDYLGERWNDTDYSGKDRAYE